MSASRSITGLVYRTRVLTKQEKAEFRSYIDMRRIIKHIQDNVRRAMPYKHIQCKRAIGTNTNYPPIK